MKKLINEPVNVVQEMLQGLVMFSSNKVLLKDDNVVIRSNIPSTDERPVAIISGGGSGHEPAHAGYIGTGMLSAAVCGEVFTSPSTDAVLEAIHATAGPKGALLIVKNYTGDRLNFGLAAEMARGEGIPVEVVVVADDVSLRHSVEPARRRGIAGTVLIHKIAGATAAAGASLDEVVRVARTAAEKLGSMGVALGGCTLPAADHAGFELGAHEIELGLGIHGEKGVKRTEMLPADQIVDTLMTAIVEDRAFTAGTHVVLLVNGLGATPEMELAIVARAALRGARERGLVVERAWFGTFLSALDMPGCSISLMQVDDGVLALLDASTDAVSWPRGGCIADDESIFVSSKSVTSAGGAAKNAANSGEKSVFQDVLLSVAKTLIQSEPILTDLDTKAGDGDLGASMERAGEAILVVAGSCSVVPSVVLSDLSTALRRAIAGSSGPFYATGLLRASRRLAGLEQPSPADWADAFTLGVEAVSELGGAKPGDRTMLDALFPAALAFSSAIDRGDLPSVAWAAAVEAAQAGADATQNMKPRLGRASYLGDRAVGVPDGGAAAVSLWIKAMEPFIR